MNHFKNLIFIFFSLVVQNIFAAGSGMFPNNADFQKCEQQAIAQFHFNYPSPPYEICVVVKDMYYGSTIYPYGYTLVAYYPCTPQAIITEYLNTPNPMASCYVGLPDNNTLPSFSSVHKNVATGNLDVPNKCGSVINPSKRTVSESIPIDGTDFNLNYSSEFNHNRSINHSLYEEFSLSTSFSGLQRIRVFDNTGKTLTTIPYVASTGTVLNWPWDEISSAVSTHPALNKGTFGYEIDRSVSGAGNPDFFSGSLSSDVISVYYTAQDGNQVSYKVALASPFEQSPGWVFEYADYKTIAVYRPEVWGLGGMTLNVHHFFDHQSKTLFHGSGEKIIYKNFQTINLAPYGTVDLVSRYEDSELYIFDQNGQHLETRSKLLGKTIHKFFYDANHKLTGIADVFNKQTQIIYNADGTLAKIIAPFGQETIFTVPNGLVTQVQDSIGHFYSLTYDDKNFLTQFQKPNQEQTNFTYNVNGDFLTESKNTGILQDFALAFNNLVKTFTANTNFGAISQIVVSQLDVITQTDIKDGNGVLKSSISLTDNSKTINFNPTSIGSLTYFYTSDVIWGTSLNEAAPYLESYTENNQNISYQPINKTTYSYANINDATSLSQIRTDVGSRDIGFNNYSVVDISQKKLQLKNDFYNLTSSIYLNDNETISRIEPATEYATDFTYDAQGRLIKKQKGSVFETYSYDQYGFVSQVTNSLNQTTQFIRDAKGQVLTKILPNQDQIKLEYTAGGEIKKITTPSNQVHYFQKDIGDYLSSYLDPNNKSTSYSYDSDKRISQIIKPSGQTINYGYETGTGHLKMIQTSQGNYSFDQIDNLDRLRQLTSPDNIKLQIEWIGRKIKSQTWKDTDGSTIGSISFLYNNVNYKPEQISINGTAVASMSYSSATGDLATINSNSYTYSYEPDSNGIKNQKISISGATNVTYITADSNNGLSPTKITQLQAHDSTNYSLFISLVRSFNTFGQAQEYTTTSVVQNTNVINSMYQLLPKYDLNNRLIEVQKNRKNFMNGQVVSTTDFYNHYLYPANSNSNMKEFTQAQSENSSPQKRTVASHGLDDRLLTLRGSINRDYTYSDDGELATMTNCYGITTYSYDAFGNLKKVVLASGKVIEYKTDGLNRRIKKLVNGTVQEYYLWYDNTHLAAVLDASKNAKLIYLYGPGSDSPSYVIKDGVEYRIAQDPGLGSIRFVIQSTTGQIAQELEYDEFGNIMKNTAANDFQVLGFAGGLYDQDTKLLHFNARDYDSSIGRWVSKDPSLFDGGTTNLYEYAFSDPMSYVDRDGKHPALIAFGIGFGIGFGSGWAIQKQIKPNSTRSELLFAGLEGGFLTGTTAVFGAVEAIGVGTTALLEASGLSFAFLSGPNNTGINLQDLNGGIKYIQGINQPKAQPQNACPGN